MAVKPITNKQVVSSANINRGNQVSTKDTTIRGNSQTTIIPGNNFSENSNAPHKLKLSAKPKDFILFVLQ